MNLKAYYNNSFRADLALLFQGVPMPEARIVALGMSWMNGCTLLPHVAEERRPQFLACLYFTVLVDQAMHSHFCIQHRRFEELTQYPKFRVGLGHPAYLNPALVFEIPIQHGLVQETDVRNIIPEAMTLFLEETASFFREHMPEIPPKEFFRRLLSDTDVNGQRQWHFAARGEGWKPITLNDVIGSELTKAVNASLDTQRD